jgi:hypothetical protein
MRLALGAARVAVKLPVDAAMHSPLIEFEYRLQGDTLGVMRWGVWGVAMLATGNSAVAAVERLKETGPRSIRFVCLLAAPEGLAHFRSHHPDVPVYTAAIDRQLNDHGYILPGLGDAGDRIFGTK